MDELKSCPFCGSPANLWRWNYGVCVECSNYHVDKHRVSVIAKTDAEAIATWNTRVKMADTVRRAKWALSDDGEKEWYCSECGYEPTVFEDSLYCAGCGAKMDGGATDES